MPVPLVPLFPLQVVVFPRTPLPLHIFEERYKEMVAAAIRENSEFGMVLAEDSRGIHRYGCSVTVENVLRRHEDGRLDILTLGRRRFEIVTVNQDKEYLRGELLFFDDEQDAPPHPLRSRLLALYERLVELGEFHAPGAANLEDPQLSFQVAQGVEDLRLKQALLESRSEGERLQRLIDHLAGLLPRKELSTRMRKLAPTNGHHHTPPSV